MGMIEENGESTQRAEGNKLFFEFFKIAKSKRGNDGESLALCKAYLEECDSSDLPEADLMALAEKAILYYKNPKERKRIEAIIKSMDSSSKSDKAESLKAEYLMQINDCLAKVRYIYGPNWGEKWVWDGTPINWEDKLLDPDYAYGLANPNLETQTDMEQKAWRYAFKRAASIKMQSEKIKKINPFADKFASKEWDGSDRIPGLCDMFTDDKEWTEMVFEAIGRQIINLSFSEKDFAHAHHCLVIQGDYGCGKSVFVERLGCGFSSTCRWSDLANDMGMKKLLKNPIIEVGEMTGFTKMDYEMAKSFLTDKTTDINVKYKTEHVSYEHRTTYIGTTNNEAILRENDRRFLVLHMKTGRELWKDESWFEQLILQWKEIYSDMIDLSEWNMSFEFENTQRLKNENELAINPQMDVLKQEVSLMDKDTVLSSDLSIAIHNRNLKLNGTNIKKAMTELGYVKKHTRHGNVWKRTTEDSIQEFEEKPALVKRSPAQEPEQALSEPEYCNMFEDAEEQKETAKGERVELEHDRELAAPHVPSGVSYNEWMKGLDLMNQNKHLQDLVY